MCVTLAPARLSHTTVLATTAMHERTWQHVMGYQNHPQSKAGPNAMLLPIPAQRNSMTPDNLILTEEFPYILTDLAKSVRPVSRAKLPADAITLSATQAIVFDHGLYTIVLAQNAAAIPPALKQVPDKKRPPLNTAIFDLYARWYPDWAIALCCFNNADIREGQPILLTYEPLFPDKLFCPGLDSHSGDIPDLSADVSIDHTLVVSTPDLQDGFPVNYRDDIPESLDGVLPNMVLGKELRGLQPNGDWWFEVIEISQGHFTPQRMTPPFN